MTREILIFGAAGQVGRSLVLQAQAHGFRPHGLRRAEADIVDPQAVAAAFERGKIALAVNAAAFTAVDKAESEPALAMAGNRDGPCRLAEACQERGLPLIHISTDYVFDGSKPTAYREDDPVAPLGTYGATKELGEQAVRRTLAAHIILRTAWIYSAEGHNFVKTMLRAGQEKDRLRVVADQRGSPTAAPDIADAILRIAARILSNNGRVAWGTFHFSGQGEATWHRFAEAIFAERARLTGQRPPTIEAITTAEFPTLAKRPANSLLDCRKLAAAYDIVAPPWQESLAAVMESLLAQAQERARA